MREGTGQVSVCYLQSVPRSSAVQRLSDCLGCKEALTATCCAHFVTDIFSSVVFCYHTARKQHFQEDARV
jgi:hypothetical protein